MDITNIVNAVITILAAVITVFIIPYIKKKTTKEQQDIIYFWVQVAVAAAEQMFKGSGNGEKKLKYVTDFIESKGFAVDTEKVRALIESAVFEIETAYATDTKEFNNVVGKE